MNEVENQDLADTNSFVRANAEQQMPGITSPALCSDFSSSCQKYAISDSQILTVRPGAK